MTQIIFECPQHAWGSFFYGKFNEMTSLEHTQWVAAQSHWQKNGKLPSSIKAVFDSQRAYLLEQWGTNGVHHNDLKGRFPIPEHSISCAIAGERCQEDVLALQTWEQVHSEQSVIHSLYKQSGEPVPAPVRRRFVQQIDLFRLGWWDGVMPEGLVTHRAILNEEERADKHQCWMDVRASHNILVWHYEHLEYLPLPFVRLAAFELEQYWKEQDPSLRI